MQLEIPFDASKFRESFAWRFQNFTMDDISYAQFARIFADVETDETTGWKLLNHVFYEAVIRHRAEEGNCFGMCFETVCAQLAHSLHRPPLSQYGPANKRPAVGQVRRRAEARAHVRSGFDPLD